MSWKCTKSSSVSSGDSSYTPAKGKRLLIFAINEQNQSKQVASVKGAADWDLRDGNGNSYKVVKTAEDNVEAGVSVNGELVYEIPADMNTFVLTVGLLSAGGSLKSWDIALE